MLRPGHKKPGCRDIVVWSLLGIVALKVFAKSQSFSIVSGQHASGNVRHYPHPTPLVRRRALEQDIVDPSKNFNYPSGIDLMRNIIHELAPLYGRREAFAKFAESLRPPKRKHKLEEIQEILQDYARKFWPNCSVALQGSAAREVDNHNFSDVDFAITGQTPYDEEIADFCDFLKHHREPDIAVYQDSMGNKKAIELKVRDINVDVSFKDQFGGASLHPAEEIEGLENFYRKYPGAVGAARVAKYLLHHCGLKGLDVEFIMHEVANNRKDLWENRDSDPQGLALFQEFVLEISNYPNSNHGPLTKLEQKARSQQGQGTLEYMKTALKRSKLVADCILLLKNLRKDSPPQEEGLAKELTEIYLAQAVPPGKGTEAKTASQSAFASAIEKPTRATSLGKQNNFAEQDAGFGDSFRDTDTIILVLDDMLYMLEKGHMTAEANRVDKKLIQFGCVGVDLFLEQVTKKKKSCRWKQRQMPSSMEELEKRMASLRVKMADLWAYAKHRLPKAFQPAIFGFLQFWTDFWEKWGSPSVQVGVQKKSVPAFRAAQ